MSDAKASLARQILANGLSYQIPPSIGLVNMVKYSVQSLEKRTYDSKETELVCQFNSGDLFVDPRSIHLCMTVSSTTADSWGNGSALALIDQVVAEHKSGQTLSNSQYLYLYHGVKDRFAESRTWRQTKGQLWLEPAQADIALGDMDTTLDTPQRVCIPLYKLCSLFDSDTLVPSNIMAGLRLRMRLNNLAEVVSSGAPGVFTFDECEVRYTSYQLSDSARKFLFMMAQTGVRGATAQMARPGLDYVYIEHRPHVESNNSQFNHFDINQSLDNVLGACVVQRLVADTNNNAESYLKCDHGADEAGFRISWKFSGVNLPDQPIKHTTDRIMYNCQSLDAKELDVSATNVVDDTPFGDFISLERGAKQLRYQGISTVSGGKKLECIIERDAAVNRSFYFYLTHVAVVRAFGSHVSVKN